MKNSNKPTIQGHRGARGLYPENTITGFIEAVKLGVDFLEMDVVISKDLKVVVSHEPWMNEVFCTKPDGSEIENNSKEKYNLYEMTYAEIKAYDCGKRSNPEFPSQKNTPEHKPLLSEVITTIETYLTENNLPSVIYNIEIKSEEPDDNLFHPEPDIFVLLVYDEIKRLNIFNNVIIQSFDVRILQKIHGLDEKIKIGLLVENEYSFEKNIELLGFFPFSYNPDFHLITDDLVKEAHSRNIQIAAWTVNEIPDMKNLTNMDVDSLITDYPNKALELRIDY
ncbi:MAG TPA: glycerophosphodiester phosphodiesterase family protein [Bacteroidia bacterium]|jgi:glycerophosphoryl diester phosphodiesterase|nr:glycerophosphodiester phosphodiesterase family protein [Bacteroidia bacterium]